MFVIQGCLKFFQTSGQPISSLLNDKRKLILLVSEVPRLYQTSPVTIITTFSHFWEPCGICFVNYNCVIFLQKLFNVHMAMTCFAHYSALRGWILPLCIRTRYIIHADATFTAAVHRNDTSTQLPSCVGGSHVYLLHWSMEADVSQR